MSETLLFNADLDGVEVSSQNVLGGCAVVPRADVALEGLLQEQQLLAKKSFI